MVECMGSHINPHIFHILARGLRDAGPLVGSRGKAPIGGLGDNVPEKLKQM